MLLFQGCRRAARSGGRSARFYRIVSLSAAAAALAAGCSSLPSEDLFETDRGRALLGSVTSKHPSSIGVTVALDEETGRSREDFGHAAHVAVDGKDLRSAFASALSRMGLFERVVEIGGDDATPEDDACVKAGRENGLDWVVVLRPTKSRVSFKGRNGWFVPSLVLWVLFWFPSLWIADEDYAADVSFNCAFYRASDGREICRGDWPGGFEASLDDFQRNLIFWGILRVPGALGLEDYEDIGRLLTRHAWNSAMTSALAALASVVESGLPPARVAAPPKTAPPDATGPSDGNQAPPGGVTTPPDAPKTPVARRAAVIVGAGEFAKPGLAPVPFAGSDALAFAKTLETSGGFRKDEISVLTGRSADLSSVKAAITALKTEGHPDDVVVFYFSGRGLAQKAAAADRLFLALSDTDPLNLTLTAFLLTDLRSALGSRKGRVRIILDTSFAGTDAPRSSGAKASDPAAVLRSLFTGKQGWACLFAAGNDGAAHELEDSSMGLFTHFLLRGLEGEAGPGQGRASLSSMSDFLASRISRMADFLGEPQDPWVSGDEMSGPVIPAIE